ncbi:MAG: SpoIIE family protein phosphatase [Treponema sp.]|nr:SpoIIE family protein phosphatase [Treponema sp.]
MGFLFLFYSFVTTMNYKRLRLEGIEKTVDIETEKVNRIIAAIERDALSLARDGLLFHKFQSREIIETSALEYLNSFPTVMGGGIWFEPHAYNNETLRTGVYAFYDKESGEVRLDEFEMDEYDYHSEAWYREIVDSIQEPYQVVWTKPYLDDTSFVMVTTAGAGVFDDKGRLIAVSNIDWELDQMVGELLAIKPTENSIVLLCAPEHSLIISSTYSEAERLASLDDIHWDIHAGSFTLDGTYYLTFSRDLDNGWLLSVPIPEKEIFADMERQNNRFSLMIIFSAFLMLCITYIVISKLVNNPIKQLTSDIAQLALGNLDMNINITSKDELGLLGQTFNKMKTDLKNSIEAFAKEHTEKERLSTELNIASDIQAKILPHVFPPFPERKEFNIYALMLPAEEVGGDFYDFFLIDSNTLAVIIADVSGKGVPSALLMAITKTLVKNYASAGHSPEEVFYAVNNTLCENNDSAMFVSAFMGYFNITSGRFVHINAGHNPPLIKKSDGSFKFIETKPGFVLGVMENTNYLEEEILLDCGDTLYLYTDGVTEAMNAGRELFSEERLVEVLNRNINCTPQELLSAVKREINGFTDKAEQTDDITMLALKVEQDTGRNKKHPEKELVVEAKMENIDEVINFISACLTGVNCLPEQLNQIILAAEEIFSNIAKYAYEPSDHLSSAQTTIGISISEEIQLKFEDTGKPFNPVEQDVPNLDEPLEDRKIGGLGIYFVKKFMDKVKYTRTGNKNILVMSKKIITEAQELGQLEEVL